MDILLISVLSNYSQSQKCKNDSCCEKVPHRFSGSEQDGQFNTTTALFALFVIICHHHYIEGGLRSLFITLEDTLPAVIYISKAIQSMAF